MPEDGEHLFEHPSFYAEFAPLEDYSGFVDSIYVLKDRGRLTARRLSFASPLRELAFSFRELHPSFGHNGRVVVNEPSFGHRKKGRAFFGWIIGIKFKPTWSGSLRTEDPIDCCLPNFVGAHHPCESDVYPDILGPLDHLLLALSQRSQQEAVHRQRVFQDIARPSFRPCKSHGRIGADAP